MRKILDTVGSNFILGVLWLLLGLYAMYEKNLDKFYYCLILSMMFVLSFQILSRIEEKKC